LLTVKAVLQTCKPRQEILAGTFNPEVFTAALSPIIEYYQNGKANIDSIYTDAHLFFGQATYPTQGLRTTLSEVFARIAGDTAVPAIHRLETAFGGGKTHTLIACTHIAYKGTELAAAVQGILVAKLLPDPGTVDVVGVAGDQIPVHKPQGEDLVPYTLWGEIAYQIGGPELYRQVEDEAGSYAAPGKIYFDKVLHGRKVLIMLDELAQYAARLEAARSDGANQLAAFLMSLHSYARNHAGIAIVITLAGATDAFARQTEQLAHLIGSVRGEEVSEDDALGIGERAVKGVTSVVARDAVQVTPVQAAEISSVLTKRLFETVDSEAAAQAAAEYQDMYARNSAMLPDVASNPDYKTRMLANYPFHPTLVDFLNQKLADAENFQGTRGVLRVLSLAVRSLWLSNTAVPMIHACHIDLRSERVVNEILGRTGSSDLLNVLNADIGSVDTGQLEGGHSNAEFEDRKNPHPEGYPLYEYTWKTVFLHSLVGRAEGLDSKIFGLSEAEALFATAFPGMTPPQVLTALQAIRENAFYLRYEQGKYYAGKEPTINSILARIRNTLSINEINERVKATARKIISGSSGMFHLEHDVSLPEDISDGKNKPVLGIISPLAESIDVEAMVTTKGENLPRLQQNMVFLLVPETTAVKGTPDQGIIFQDASKASETRKTMENTARQVLAMRKLSNQPQKYGVKPGRLQDEEFQKRFSERENALHTVVAGAYTSLYYPSTSGHIVRKEIKTAGGEGGVPFIEIIVEILKNDGELLTSQNTTQADLLNLSKLFFKYGDNIALKDLQNNFLCQRDWPVLEENGILQQIIREGVRKGTWYLYRMGAPDNVKPEEFYHPDKEVPMGVSLAGGGYSIITPAGAKQRSWTDATKQNPDKVRDGINYVMKNGIATVAEVQKELEEKQGEIAAVEVLDGVSDLIKAGRLMVFHGSAEQTEKPNLIYGTAAALYTPQEGDVLITRAQAAERGWLGAEEHGLRISGTDKIKELWPVIRRLGSIYSRGGKSTIDHLDIMELTLPDGGSITLQLSGVTPGSAKALGEFFEVLDSIATAGDESDIDIEISDPAADCSFIEEIKNKPAK